jgi:hypothetical protein
MYRRLKSRSQPVSTFFPVDFIYNSFSFLLFIYHLPIPICNTCKFYLNCVKITDLSTTISKNVHPR